MRDKYRPSAPVAIGYGGGVRGGGGNFQASQHAIRFAADVGKARGGPAAWRRPTGPYQTQGGRLMEPTPRPPKFSPYGSTSFAKKWIGTLEEVSEWFREAFGEDWANQGGTGVAPLVSGFSLEKMCTKQQSEVCGFAPNYWTAPGPDATYPRCDVCIPALPQSTDMPTIASPLAEGGWLLKAGLAAAAQNGPLYWYKRRSTATTPTLGVGYAKPLPWSAPPQGAQLPAPNPRSGSSSENKGSPYRAPYERSANKRDRRFAFSPDPKVQTKTQMEEEPPGDRRQTTTKYDRKVNIPAEVATWLKLYHGVTELLEAVDCLYDSLPDGLRGGPVTGIDKMVTVFSNLGSVDYVAAGRCIAYNQFIEDRLVGTAIGKLGKQLKGAGGPSTTQVTQFGRQMTSHTKGVL